MKQKKGLLSHLTVTQKVSLCLFLLLLIAFPLIYFASQLTTRIAPRAYLPGSEPRTTLTITTTHLPIARPGVAYTAQINGEDSLTNGTSLIMNISGLPTGFSKGPCSLTTVGATNTPFPTKTPTPIKTLTPKISIVPTRVLGESIAAITGAPTVPYTSTPTKTPTPTTVTWTPTPTRTPTPTPQSGKVLISCRIQGSSAKQGSYPVNVVLKNTRTGGYTQKVLYLTVGSVTPTPTRTPTPVPWTPTPTR